MEVDVQSLGTFNQLAHSGAERATAALEQMTGIDATVEVTQITLIDRADVGQRLGVGTFTGVQFDFEGALRGETVLVFDEGSTEEIVGALMPGASADGEMGRSSVKEIGNIMMSGFIDGWADYLEAAIDHTPPAYIERTGTEVVPESEDTGAFDQVFVFRSEIRWAGADIGFYIYMLPAYEPMAELLAAQAEGTDDAIPIAKLEAFNRMTREGTENAASNVEMMSGIETDAEVSQISFAPIEDVPKALGEETVVGTVVEFTGTPSGYLVVLFDEGSAKTVAEALMPVEMETEELTDKHKDAIEELGNIITSGFVDGWANVLQQSIEHTPPKLVHDMGQSILDPLAAQLGQHQRHAFVIDSRMETDEIDFECEIYALPNEAELREALDRLAVDRADQTDADVEQIF